MESKMYEFLQEVKNGTVWADYLTPRAVINLASALDEVNALFLRSKITLRSRVFSLYTGKSGKRIHRVSIPPCKSTLWCTVLIMVDRFSITSPQLSVYRRNLQCGRRTVDLMTMHFLVSLIIYQSERVSTH
jgi:hypothetical protein